jgi:hypothetical protein
MGAVEESDGAGMALIGHDLGKSETRSVVDHDMHELPTGSWSMVAAIAGDAMACALDAAEFFDVEMDELARELALVAHDWRGGIEGGEVCEAVAVEEARNGGFGESTLARDLKSGQAQPTQGEDDGYLGERCLPGAAQRT